MRLLCCAALLLFAGCSNGIGQSCTTTSDCANGLICDIPQTPDVDGVCSIADGGMVMVGDALPPGISAP